MLSAVQVNEVRLHDSHVQLRVGPFWLRADASARDLETLIELEGTTTVATHLEWDEAGPRLYVFADPTRRDLFAALRLIDGVGAHTALAIIGVGDTHDILRAAAGADADFFCQVPGIGPKRALAVIAGVEAANGRPLPAPVGVPMREFITARDALAHGDVTPALAEALLGAVIDANAPTGRACAAERLLDAVEELRDAT